MRQTQTDRQRDLRSTGFCSSPCLNSARLHNMATRARACHVGEFLSYSASVPHADHTHRHVTTRHVTSRHPLSTAVNQCQTVNELYEEFDHLSSTWLLRVVQLSINVRQLMSSTRNSITGHRHGSFVLFSCQSMSDS